MKTRKWMIYKIEQLEESLKEKQETIEKYNSREYKPSIECRGCDNLIEEKSYVRKYGHDFECIDFYCKLNNKCSKKNA